MKNSLLYLLAIVFMLTGSFHLGDLWRRDHTPKTVTIIEQPMPDKNGVYQSETDVVATLVIDPRSFKPELTVELDLYTRLSTGECYTQRLKVNREDIFRQTCPTDNVHNYREWLATGWNAEMAHQCALSVMSIAFGPGNSVSKSDAGYDLVRQSCEPEKITGSWNNAD